ncbi:hypothetical protein SUGI_0534600 [Cryptomeria japonica]|nr:hypothetical protein SUGI_0534600 [Cryptomeria japonica]
MKWRFSSHHPACLETALPLVIEHDLHYNVILVGKPKLIALEQAVRSAMVPVGSTRQKVYGKKVPLLEIEAKTIEPIFRRLYTYLFCVEEYSSAAEINGPMSNAIFILIFDKIEGLTTEQMMQQEGSYIHRYRYNGGGASQMWLSSSRYVVIDLSASPCTYGKIETEKSSVSYITVPSLLNILFQEVKVLLMQVPRMN